MSTLELCPLRSYKKRFRRRVVLQSYTKFDKTTQKYQKNLYFTCLIVNLSADRGKQVKQYYYVNLR